MPLNYDQSRSLLDELWESVLSETGGEVSEEINRLIRSKLVAIRYSLPTQILGKLSNHGLDALSTQKGDGSDKSAWDPRSFASSVIVPWVTENQNVLGTSSDPYVSNPLRRSKIKADAGNVRGKADWLSLYEILNDIQTTNDPDYTRERFLEVLRAIRKRLAELSFEYYIPERISIEQTLKVVGKFLAESSGGDRALSVAAALFMTFGNSFDLYSEVVRHVINASDRSTGLSADIECKDENGEVLLAVEVKERDLTLMDVKIGIRKARRGSISEYLFNSPRTKSADESEITNLIGKTWNSGTNLYRFSIDELIRVGLALAGEKARRDFLGNVGEQLNAYNTQPSVLSPLDLYNGLLFSVFLQLSWSI